MGLAGLINLRCAQEGRRVAWAKRLPGCGIDTRFLNHLSRSASAALYSNLLLLQR